MRVGEPLGSTEMSKRDLIAFYTFLLKTGKIKVAGAAHNRLRYLKSKWRIN
tara:strand:+ start:1637 stop:1789 length:153 start_codon:yes stop_codon:yes gene_type:complete